MLVKKILPLAAAVAVLLCFAATPASAYCSLCTCSMACSTPCTLILGYPPITCGVYGVCTDSYGCNNSASSFTYGISVDGIVNAESNCNDVGESKEALLADAGNDKVYDKDGQASRYDGSDHTLDEPESNNPGSLESNSGIDTLIDVQTYPTSDK